MRTTLLITVFYIFPQLLNAQSIADQNVSYLGVGAHYGFIIPHSAAVEDHAYTKPAGLKISYGKIVLKEKHYKIINRFSKAGMSLHWYDYRYPDVLGHSFNFSVYGEPVFMFHNRLYAATKAGMGVSYMTKYYDAETNPDNKFFSYPLSFLLYLSLSLNYKLNENWTVQARASYPHISNGGIKQPNYGMNFPSFGIGAEYVFFDYKLPDYSYLHDKRNFKPQNNIQFDAFICAKNINAAEIPADIDIADESIYDAQLMWIYGMQARLSRNITQLNTISFAGEWIADNYDRIRIERRSRDLSHHKIAAMIGHEFVFGRFSFRQQLAFYVFAPFDKDIMYQRYSLSYEVSEQIIFGASLKAHRHVADIFDVRLGWRI